MKVNTTQLDSFPANSNPYDHDFYHMGTRIGTDLLMMHANHATEEMKYFILVNTKTGKRVKVTIEEDVVNPSDLTTDKRFKLCLKEAKKLVSRNFSPELDNLATQTIGSILYKVLIELDMMYEGHIKTSEKTKIKIIEATSKFFVRWRDYVEDEKEKQIYKDYK